MDEGLFELVENIFWVTMFIALGGTAALLFLLIFAQSISGSKTTHSQLNRLIGQTERMNEQLKEIGRTLKKEQAKSEEEEQGSK